MNTFQIHQEEELQKGREERENIHIPIKRCSIRVTRIQNCPQALFMKRFMLTTILLWGQDYNNNS